MAASASGGRDWYAALPLPWRTDSLGYVLRSIGAAALALGLGLYLQLDSPFSAASTVLLLINPVQGAVVGKGWWRAVGTLVGTLAAFVLTALFAQKMLLFVVALGFWLGLCVGVMSLVRHFYATAAVVAGYTLGPAMVEPEAAFEHIVTRASAVIVGVCCLSLVTVLFSRRTVSGRVRQRLVSLCAATLALVAARHAGAADGELERRRRTLAGEVYAVDDLLGVGRAESRALSAALPAIRGGLAALFSTPLRRRDALGPALGGAWTGAADGRRPVPAGRPTGARRARLRRRRATARELARSPGGDSARTSDRPSGCLSRRAVHGASRRATG